MNKMLDIFSLISPLVTATLPTSLDTPSFAHATEVYSFSPSLYFCRTQCPFCGCEHSHGVDVFLLMQSENETHQHFAVKCANGGDYWVSLTKWVQEGRVTVVKKQLQEGELIWL
jgi:hypothetical protein